MLKRKRGKKGMNTGETRNWNERKANERNEEGKDRENKRRKKYIK